MLDVLINDLTDLRLWLVVLTITAIGVANKYVYYQAGKQGGKVALDKFHGFTPKQVGKVSNLYEPWGKSLLLLASIPVIGSAISVLSGIGEVAMPVFIVLVAISNLVRNWLIVILAGGITQLVS